MSAGEHEECNDFSLDNIDDHNDDTDNNDDTDSDSPDDVDKHHEFLDSLLENEGNFHAGYGPGSNPSPIDDDERRQLQEATGFDDEHFSDVDSDASEDEKSPSSLPVELNASWPAFSETDTENGYTLPVPIRNHGSPEQQPHEQQQARIQPRSSSEPIVIRLPSADGISTTTKKKTKTKTKLLRATHSGDMSQQLVRPPLALKRVFDTLKERGMVIPSAELPDVDDRNQQVGSGYFSVVRQVCYKNEPVAVKLMYKQEDDRQFMVQLKREVRNLLHVSDHGVHRVVKLLGVTMDRVGVGLVFPYYREGCLRKYLSTRRPDAPPYPWRYRLMREIALALASLHWVGLIHSDVTAENILVDVGKDGAPRPLLADLGLSRFHNHMHTSSHDSIYRAGHLSTRAPETMNGKLCTTKADIFSLSIVFWEVITLNTKQQAPKEDATNHTLGIRRKLGAVPEEIRPLLESMWDQRPERRPTAKDVAATLKLLLAPPRAPSGSPVCSTSSERIAQEERDVWDKFKQRTIKTPKKKPSSGASSSSSCIEITKSTPKGGPRKKQKSERSKLSMEKHMNALRLNSVEQDRPSQLFDKHFSKMN